MDTITWDCGAHWSWRTTLYSFKTMKSLLRPVAPQFDNYTKYIFSGYWIVGVASIMQLLEAATLGCVFMPSVRWAHISSQVLTSFPAKLPPCSYVPERNDMCNWGQCESRFTVIISGMEQWEGTSPNEAGMGSKAWPPYGMTMDFCQSQRTWLGMMVPNLKYLAENSIVAWAVTGNDFGIFNLDFGFIHVHSLKKLDNSLTLEVKKIPSCY